MSLQKLITSNVSYNNWVAQQYIQWLSGQSEEILRKETPSSFNTIIATLHHIWTTQEYWRGIIMDESIEAFNYFEQEFDIDMVMKGYLRSSEQFRDQVLGLSEEALHTKVKVESEWFQSDLPRYEYILHAIHHGFYHRGQIVTMGRNIGLTGAPMTDYNFYNVTVGAVVQ